MLPLDLLNELLTLLDDASTYRSLALASRITSRLCLKDEDRAKNRFTMLRKDAMVDCYQLPDYTLHGPFLSYVFTRYGYYVNGECEGPSWEWYSYGFELGGGRFVSTYFHKGQLHGRYRKWSMSGDLVKDVNYVENEIV